MLPQGRIHSGGGDDATKKAAILGRFFKTIRGYVKKREDLIFDDWGRKLLYMNFAILNIHVQGFGQIFMA